MLGGAPPASTTTGASRRSAPSTSRAASCSAGTRCRSRGPTTSTATSSTDTQRAANDCTGVAGADVYLPELHGHQPDVQRRPRLLRLGREHVPQPRRPVALVPHDLAAALGLTRARARSRTRWDTASGSALVGALQRDLRLALGRDERRVGQLSPDDPTYGCVGTQTISYHKDLLGWIPSNRRYVAALGTSQTITLEPLDQLASSGYMIAQIPLPDPPPASTPSRRGGSQATMRRSPGTP